MAHIILIQGHPDSGHPHFGHALADAYIHGAQAAGHEVKQIKVSELNLPLLNSKDAWLNDLYPDAVRDCQHEIAWADHLVIIYPLWLGTMPAMLKAFFEQVFRPGFAIDKTETHKMWKKLLSDKSARIVITMGMPGFIYRWYFGAHSLKSLQRNILAFCGIGPIKSTLIGQVEAINEDKRKAWLEKMDKLGKKAA